MNAPCRAVGVFLLVVAGPACGGDDDVLNDGFTTQDSTGTVATGDEGDESEGGEAGDDIGPPATDEGSTSSSGSEGGEVSGDAGSASLLTTGGEDETGGTGSSSSTGGPADACDAYEPAVACASRDGLDVFCVEPGASFEIEGRVSYGPGFPDGLPALGLGHPGLGYIPVSSPLTCAVHLCDTAETDGNSALSDGHICEATFPNGVAGETEAWSLYRVDIPLDAVEEDHLLGFTTNFGATVVTPDFYLRITEPEG